MDEKIIIPIGLFLAACWSTYRGIKSSKSGYTDGSGTVPFYKTGGGLFAIILFAAAIGVTIWMISER